MWGNENSNSGVPVSAVFCELFTATNAVRALSDQGFEESDVDVVGALNGRVPELACFLRETGVPSEQVSYYENCFEEGAVLVVVHVKQSTRKRRARAVLKEQGGSLAPPQD